MAWSAWETVRSVRRLSRSLVSATPPQGGARVIGDDALGRSGWDEARPRGTNEARKASLTIISQEKKPF